MSLATSPTTVVQTIPSYLYFQYQTDQDIPSLIQSYNRYTQNVVDWFNALDLPIYTTKTGDFLDVVGGGIYGYSRPQLSTYTRYPFIGATSSYPTARYATSGADQNYSSSGAVADDDIYKRCLTWQFYKGDGFQFTIPWLKRRIYRWLNGVNGVDIPIAYTDNVSVEFSRQGSDVFLYYIGPTASIQTAYQPTAMFEIVPITIPVYFKPEIIITLTGYDGTLVSQFIDSINSGAITFPFQYNVIVNT